MASEVAPLLARLRYLGVAVRRDGDRLLARPLAVVPDELRSELRRRKQAVLDEFRRVDVLRERYDELLARFHRFPDTPEAVASPEWLETIEALNGILLELEAAGCPATDGEVVCGFFGRSDSERHNPR